MQVKYRGYTINLKNSGNRHLKWMFSISEAGGGVIYDNEGYTTRARALDGAMGYIDNKEDPDYRKGDIVVTDGDIYYKIKDIFHDGADYYINKLNTGKLNVVSVNSFDEQTTKVCDC